jgi:hypothetical protein
MPFGWVLLDQLMEGKSIKDVQKVLFYVHYLFETVRIRIKQSDLDPY